MMHSKQARRSEAANAAFFQTKRIMTGARP
jgi:hypothetical protein